MPPGKPSSNLQSVLARFEQTIEKNNVTGVASGMYLTKLASSSRDTGTSKVRLDRSSHTRSKHSSKKPVNDVSNQPIPRNSNRSRDGSLRSDTDKRSVRSNERAKKEEKGDWKEFTDYSKNAKFNASFDSLLGGGDDQSSISDMSQETFAFDDVTFDDPFNPNIDEEFNPFGLVEVVSIPEAVEKKQRPPREKRGVGRLGNRTTKSQRDMRAAKKSKEKLLGENTEEVSSEEGDDDVEISHSVQDCEDDDGGFSLTYVASRDGNGSQRHPNSVIREGSTHRRGNKSLEPDSRGRNDSIRRSEDINRPVREKRSETTIATTGSERDESPSKSKNAVDFRQNRSKESDSKPDRIIQKQDEMDIIQKGRIDDSAHSHRMSPLEREKLNSRGVHKSSRLEMESAHRRRFSPPQREKLLSRDSNKSSRLETESAHRRTFSPTQREKLLSRDSNKSGQVESEPTRSPSRSPPQRERLSSRANHKSSRLESESTHSRTHSLSQQEKFNSRDNHKSSRLESESTHSRTHSLSQQEKVNSRDNHKTSRLESESAQDRNIGLSGSSSHRRNKTYGTDGKSSHGRKFSSTLDPNSAQSRFFGGDAKVKVRTKPVKTLEDSGKKSTANSEGMDFSDHSKQSFNSKISATSKVSTNSLLLSNSKVSSSASRPIGSARQTYGVGRKPQLVSRSNSIRNH
jgi:hypothetical protein